MASLTTPPVSGFARLQRRRLFAGATVLATAGTGHAATQHPDALLLAICAEAERADDLAVAASRRHGSMHDDDPGRAAVLDESDEFFDAYARAADRAAALPALTVDGMRAKASLALRDMSTVDGFELVKALLRDIAGRA